MKRESIDSKKRIMETMVQLLMEKQDVNKLTTRQIAELANVNSALINYYYQSKENLIAQAVDICMENIVNMLFDEKMREAPPASRLKSMIKEIASFCFDNYYLLEIAVSNEIRHGSINTSGRIVPLLSEIFKETKTENELKLIALQIIAPMQIVFLNAKEYKAYLSKDLNNEQVRNEFLDQMIDNMIRQAGVAEC
ncbi:MAG: TetR/AcrR family transcriptional regulator [Eubacteriales bacterium]|nr:TetR/AcrR family transcriptional regulator [Eubacteriales bacterium]